MINFLEQQNKIKAYIKENLPAVLNEAGLSDFDSYITDFLDLDKYQKKLQLFFDFGNYNFNSLSNESNSEEIELTVYLTFKGASAEELNNLMMKYTAGFYEMFERSNCNFKGLVDFGIIETVSFYQATEANINVKLSEIKLKLQTER